MIKLLLDVGLPRRAAADLRALGFQTDHAGELGLAEAADTKILDFAGNSGYSVVALDFDFVRILALESRTVPSVVHLRLPDLDRRRTVALLSEIVPRLAESLEKGCIASVGATGIRIRSLPVVQRGQR